MTVAKYIRRVVKGTAVVLDWIFYILTQLLPKLSRNTVQVLASLEEIHEIDINLRLSITCFVCQR